MSTPYESFQPNYRVPKKVQRMTSALAYAVALGIVLVAVPLVALYEIGAYGISSSIPFALVIAGGIAVAVVSGYARYRKPTTKYGPTEMLASGISIIYLFLLSLYATASWHGTYEGRAVSITIGYGEVFFLFMLVPLLGILVAALITLQDRRYPGKRLLKDYPAK